MRSPVNLPVTRGRPSAVMVNMPVSRAIRLVRMTSRTT
jgi:hypothetical protein